MSPETITRQSQSRNTHATIRLSQVRTEKPDGAKTYTYGHRSLKEYDKKALEEFIKSLVQEGLATPLTIYQPDPSKEVYSLVSGFRRYSGLQEAIRQNSDPDLIHKDMDIQVVIMEQGEDQSDAEFKNDIFVRSVTENEQRKKLDPKERLNIVERFSKTIDDRRGASALGISASQYSRDKLVVELPWLAKSVLANEIAPTDAAKLADAAIGKDKQGNERKQGKLFKEEWEKWIEKCEELWADEVEKAEKLNKELGDDDKQHKKYLSSKLVTRFVTCLKEGIGFDEEVNVPFLIEFDREKRKLAIKGFNASLSELDEDKVLDMMAEMQAGLKKLALVQKQVEYDALAKEDAGDDYYEAVLERARQRAEAKKKGEKGKEVNQAEPDPPQTEDLAEEVRRKRQEQETAEAEEDAEDQDESGFDEDFDMDEEKD